MDTISDLSAELGENRRNLIRLKRYFNQTIRVMEELDSLGDQMKTVPEHCDMQTAPWQNRSSYALPAIDSLSAPLGFLTGLLGVNIGGVPGIDQPATFAILPISMVFIAAVAVGLLRWKRRL